MAIPQKLAEARKKLVDEVCDALEQGTGKWRQTWETMQNNPMNAVTGRSYRGGNAIMLGFTQMAMRSQDNRWCTFNQASKEGWKIKAGSKGMPVTYWDMVKDEEHPEEVKYVRLKSFTVFHASHVEGMPPQEKREFTPVEKIEKAERILAESGAKIEHAGDQPFYSPARDMIVLPERDSFHTSESYYTTALHELGHWTGHSSRLNREGITKVEAKSEGYAREELIAELSSMFVGGETGLIPDQSHFDNHAAYIGSWIKALKEDPNELFRAAAEADKAANLILVHEHDRRKEIELKVGKVAEVEGSPLNDRDLEKEIKALKLIGGDVKVYTKPNATGNYQGEILHVDREKGYAVQQVGKVSLVAHKTESLARLPEKGENVRIIYRNDEKAKVLELEKKKERQQVQGM